MSHHRTPPRGNVFPDISQLVTTSLPPRQPPGDTLPDISQLATTRLVPRQSHVDMRAHQIAQHQAEIQRLCDLADAVEQAITALIIRVHMTRDQGRQEVLEHNRADLQRYKDELDSLQVEHQRAIERIQSHRKGGRNDDPKYL